MIKGAIFDLDGTLIDSMIIWAHTGERYLAKKGVTASPDLNETLYTLTIEGGARYMKETYKLAETVDEVVSGINDMVKDFYANEVAEKPGAVELLSHMKQDGVMITLATSNSRELIMPALERLNMLPYIDRIFTCPEEHTTKSEPDIFLTAAGYMNTEPDETWVFEDSYYSIKAASDAGFRTVGIYDRESCQNQELIRETADLYYTEIPLYQKIEEAADAASCINGNAASDTPPSEGEGAVPCIKEAADAASCINGNAASDMPPSEGEGAIHCIEEAAR